MGYLRAIALALVSVAVCFIATSESCHAKGGWGQEGILIPKPTLIPKLAAAFHDGKKSVNLSKGKPLIYHKFKTDSFKTDGWSGGSTKSNLNGLGWGDYEYGYAVKAPYTGDYKKVYEKGIKGVGVKGHYSTHDKHSFKHLSYGYGWDDTPSYGGGWGWDNNGWGWDSSDYGKK